MAELIDHVGALADQIGPRPVSTEEEHQTSLYVAQELTDEGYDVSVDEFATPTGVRWPYAIAFALAAFGTFVSGIGFFVPGISLSMHIVGLILILAALFIYYSEYNNRPFLSKMRAGGVSQNVVGKYIPPNMTREARRRKVIIVAHVDTVRAEPEALPQFIVYTPLLRKIIFYCMIGLPVVAFIRLLPFPWPDAIDLILWVISLFASIYVLVAAGCIVANRFMPYVSGGNDNASAVAVLLSVAKRLVDPEARERYIKERPIAQENEYSASVFDVETDSDAPAEDAGDKDEDGYYDEDLEEPFMHDEDEAIKAGVVPDGASIEYDDDGDLEDATVAFPALTPEQQLDVLADASAVETARDGETAETLSLDDIGAEPSVDLEAIREIKVPELDFTLDEGVEAGAQHEPTEKLADTVVFADYLPKDDEKAEPQVEEPTRLDASEFAELDFGEAPNEEEATIEEISAEITSDASSSEEAAKPTPAPVYAPITSARPKRERRRRSTGSVPSWYIAAKEKAAKDLEERVEEMGAGEEEPVVYRSRFADMPIRPRSAMDRAQQEQASSEPAEEPQASAMKAAEPVESVAEQVTRGADTPDEADAPESPSEKPESSDVPENAAQEQDEQQAIDLEIPDDQLDELTPDASGLFAPIKIKAQDASEKSEEMPQELTSRIPNIGTSDDRERDERRAVQEERAAREVRPELQGIPTILEGEAAKEVADEAEKPAQKASAAKSKPSRKRPTARHLTQEFTPTPAVDARDNKPFGDKRQEAPVSSTYEDSAEDTPAFDPFAPSDEQYAEPVQTHAAPQRRASSFEEAPATRTSDFAQTSNSPSATSSFPSLTGSFPALSGSIPAVSADDFAEPAQQPAASDAAIDDFTAGQTSDINMPQSRFHNAVDKVGGLFGRKKGAKNEDSEIENWNDDDDFGWKGGAYYDGEAESAFDAARERAAQIRDSVVAMTESDMLDKEVWFVALGASNAGNQGMKNFLDLHSSELRGSLIINIEAVGAGKINYIDLEGTSKPNRSDRRLQSLVKKASKELKGTEMKPRSLEWRNTDATPAMIAGMRAITLMGFDENGVAPVAWHTAADTSDIVDEDNLEYVSRLLMNIIENA